MMREAGRGEGEKGRREKGKGEVFDRVINIPPLFYLEASEALEKFKGHF